MSDLYPDHREDLQSRSQIGGSTFSCKPHPGEREREKKRERERESERGRGSLRAYLWEFCLLKARSPSNPPKAGPEL